MEINEALNEVLPTESEIYAEVSSGVVRAMDALYRKARRYTGDYPEIEDDLIDAVREWEETLYNRIDEAVRGILMSVPSGLN